MGPVALGRGIQSQQIGQGEGNPQLDEAVGAVEKLCQREKSGIDQRRFPFAGLADLLFHLEFQGAGMGDQAMAKALQQGRVLLQQLTKFFWGALHHLFYGGFHEITVLFLKK